MLYISHVQEIEKITEKMYTKKQQFTLYYIVHKKIIIHTIFCVQTNLPYLWIFDSNS